MTDTTRVLASSLQPGDVILPPERELRLWMRRTMPESALPLTITAIVAGPTDKKGPWLVLVANAADERVGQWRIKVRPSSPWPRFATPSTQEG